MAYKDFYVGRVGETTNTPLTQLWCRNLNGNAAESRNVFIDGHLAQGPERQFVWIADFRG